MIHTFEFNNKKLLDIGAVLMEKPHYPMSAKELDFTAVPGKSRDIITDKNRFKNSSISYKVSSYPLFCSYTEQEFVYILSEWLLTSYDYKILRDTYNKGYFRKAICTSISDPTVEADGMVWTTVTFNCDPFLYNDAGLQTVTYTNLISTPAYLTNLEQWESEPIIKVSGNGMFTVTISGNSFTITLESSDGEITIDKPNENVYDSGGNNCNDKINAKKLPYLKAGQNKISVIGTGDNFTLKIIPNWRRL